MRLLRRFAPRNDKLISIFTILNRHPPTPPSKGREITPSLTREGVGMGAIPQGKIFFYKKNPPSAQDVSP